VDEAVSSAPLIINVSAIAGSQALTSSASSLSSPLLRPHLSHIVGVVGARPDEAHHAVEALGAQLEEVREEARLLVSG
jgi:hypothetical protein